MKRNNVACDLGDARFMSIDEGAAYIRTGKRTARLLFERIGAVRHVGKRRVIIDRAVVDAYFNQTADADKEVAASTD